MNLLPDQVWSINKDVKPKTNMTIVFAIKPTFIYICFKIFLCIRVGTDIIHTIVKICLFLIINTDINTLHSRITWSSNNILIASCDMEVSKKPSYIAITAFM
jgi:hypothetical protein